MARPLRIEYAVALFRGRYKPIVVEQDEYMLELVRYIHRDAIKAGLAEKLGEYLWDSQVM